MMANEKTVTIYAEYYERLKDLAEAATRLSEVYIPKVNHGASFMSPEAFAALNDFECAVRKIGTANEKNVS